MMVLFTNVIRQKSVLFISLLVLWSSCSFAAGVTASIVHQPLVFTRIANTLVIDSHWYVYTEADNRVFLSPVKESQFIARVVGRYVFNNSVEMGLGFVTSSNFPGDSKSTSNLITPEFRPTFDITFKQRFGKLLVLSHRNVIENRFIHYASSTELQNGYKYVFRYRYRLQADFLLFKKTNHALKFILSDEIMLQAGKDIVYNVFDQNRVYAGLNYEPMKWLAFEAGYMNWFQERSSGKDFYSRHIFRFSVFTKIYIPTKNK